MEAHTPEISGYVARAHDYAQRVVGGQIVAGRYTRLACQRHLDDLARWQDDPAAPYWFDGEPGGRAEDVCHYLEALPHVKGRWARHRELLRLGDWQCFMLCVLYGWVHRGTGLRRFNTALIEVGKKNGKSAMLSGLSLYHLDADGEQGGEVYSAATQRQQARIVFDTARQMAMRSPWMLKRVTVFTHNLSVDATFGKFEPVCSKDTALDGLNPSMVCVDELHLHKSDAVWGVFSAGMGAREQPMLISITTAGTATNGVWMEQRNRVKKILDGTLEEPQYFGIIYALDEPEVDPRTGELAGGDDWQDEGLWPKANPNLGVSFSLEHLRQKYRDALSASDGGISFKAKHLGLPTEHGASWLPMARWKDGAAPAVFRDDAGAWHLERFAGTPAWYGCDLASVSDLTAVAVLFRWEERWHLTARLYLPSDTVERAHPNIRLRYKAWVEQGWLITTPGPATDHNVVQDDFRRVAEQLPPQAVGYDPAQAMKFATELADEGYPMVQVRQWASMLSEPMNWLKKMVLTEELTHDGSPAMRWMMSNVVVLPNRKDEVFPRKQNEGDPTCKIDGPVATIIAASQAHMEVGLDAGPGLMILGA